MNRCEDLSVEETQKMSRRAGLKKLKEYPDWEQFLAGGIAFFPQYLQTFCCDISFKAMSVMYGADACSFSHHLQLFNKYSLWNALQAIGGLWTLQLFLTTGFSHDWLTFTKRTAVVSKTLLTLLPPSQLFVTDPLPGILAPVPDK